MSEIDPLAITTLHSDSDFEDANDLYRGVFQITRPNLTLNPRLLSVIGHYGGSTVGARDNGKLVAFGYGFTGIEDGAFFHYSQMVCIDPAYQSLGLGRRIKEAQRAIAVENGLTQMRWSFDPWLARNAHFNFDTLGGLGRWFTPNYYEVDSPVPTDARIIVDWPLDAPYPRSTKTPPELPETADTWGKHFIGEGGDWWVPLPDDPNAGSAHENERGRQVLVATLTELFNDGFKARSCQRFGTSSTAYLLTKDI